MGTVPFDYQQWEFGTDFVVSRTEYTDVQFMLAASRTAASGSSGILRSF